MSQEFISHDGADGNGIRAEVVVVKGRGKVTDIVLGNKDRSVQVSFMEENLKNPIKGWANVGTPIHAEVLRAKETGEDVNYRIEIQRKSFIPRDMPMDEVRPKGDMITANKNAIRILAGVNETVSDEAVTHPSEDVASTYGRHKATGAETRPASTGGASISTETLVEGLKTLATSGVSPEVQASALGVAIALGVSPHEAFSAVSSEENAAGERPPVKTSFSGEGKPWEWWNSDGRENLGHARFSAGSGAESFVREQLTALGVDNSALKEGVEYFTNIILSIADRVQEKIYGEGYRPDRASSSHARIRGIIYDTVEHYHQLPINVPKDTDANAVIKAWIAEVGNEAFERFQIVVHASNAPTNFSIPLPVGIYGVQATPAKPKVEEVAEKAPEAPVKSAKVAPKADIQKVKEVAVEAPVPAEEVVSEDIVEPIEVEESPVAEETVDISELAIFDTVDVDSLPEEEKSELASEETVAYFRQLIEEAGIPDSDLKLVANLLRKTFGKNYSKAQQLPESVLTDFIDFYAGAGEENLRKVIQNS